MSTFKISAKARQFLLYKAEMLDSGTQLKGWKQFKSTTRDMSAFYNTKCGIVVKKPKFILERRTPLSLRVPTVSLGDGWVAQPLVRKTNLRAALTALRASLKPHLGRGIFPDLHRGNVGWYGKKPVLFDW
jgi:hypothetical protein